MPVRLEPAAPRSARARLSLHCSPVRLVQKPHVPIMKYKLQYFPKDLGQFPIQSAQVLTACG